MLTQAEKHLHCVLESPSKIGPEIGAYYVYMLKHVRSQNGKETKPEMFCLSVKITEHILNGPLQLYDKTISSGSAFYNVVSPYLFFFLQRKCLLSSNLAIAFFFVFVFFRS